MAETIRGKGVISGIAVGQVLLAGQNLDGYLAAYKAGAVDEDCLLYTSPSPRD